MNDLFEKVRREGKPTLLPGTTLELRAEPEAGISILSRRFKTNRIPLGLDTLRALLSRLDDRRIIFSLAN